MDNVTYKLEQLENEGMIEQMHHDWYAFTSLVVVCDRDTE